MEYATIEVLASDSEASDSTSEDESDDCDEENACETNTDSEWSGISDSSDEPYIYSDEDEDDGSDEDESMEDIESSDPEWEGVEDVLATFRNISEMADLVGCVEYSVPTDFDLSYDT